MMQKHSCRDRLSGGGDHLGAGRTRGPRQPLGRRLFSRHAGGHPGRQNAALLRRPDQGQDRGGQLHLHELPRPLPIVTARLAQVKDKLGDAVGRDIFFVSMTVDPEHDTPEMLKAYADAFDANAPGWQFVTGPPEDIKAINAKFGDRSADRSLGNIVTKC